MDEPILEREDPQLSELFGPEHVLPELQATDQKTVIEEIVAFVSAKGLVADAKWLEASLRARERMVPTAMPNGVAFLHARHRAPEKFPRQFLALARSSKGVPFGSPDDKPTHLFFLLGLRRDQAHLRWLARLSWICRRRATVANLLQAKDAEDIVRHMVMAVEELPGNLKIRG
ncbi:MAG: PTS sugar transporter subunit IIA [Thermoanaerobaculum sp.]